ncbi:MAG: aminotransferase class V-fold PLP-dependent enzyme, partial [Saprospiraceae bacterium]
MDYKRMLMDNRRNFLKTAGLASGLGLIVPMTKPQLNRFIDFFEDYSNIDSHTLASDEEFWSMIQQAFTVSSSIINLNNGGVAPAPKVVQDAAERFAKFSNEAPSYYMWRILDQGREPLRRKLADLAGVAPDQVAMQRNASEALETVIFGLRLEKGDEVILSKQDYPNMINAWKQREKRDGIILKWLDHVLPQENSQVIIKKFEEAISPKTKIIHLTHIINWMGQIMPAKEIISMAHSKNIEVVLDGAHSFGHIQYSVSDLDCDYFGTSLHKWISAPIGTGLLIVKKDKIKNLYPLFAAPDAESDDIRKFENLGTRPFHIEQATGQAIQFHQMIGGDRKQKRLHYLKNYWATKALQQPGVKIGTSLKPEYGCGIGLLQIDGKTPSQIDSFLFEKYKIHAVGITWENISGVRITPNVYTLTSDLDVLVE